MTRDKAIHNGFFFIMLAVVALIVGAWKPFVFATLVVLCWETWKVIY